MKKRIITILMTMMALLTACGGSTETSCRCEECNQNQSVVTEVEEKQEEVEVVKDSTETQQKVAVSEEASEEELPVLSKEEFDEMMKKESNNRPTIFLENLGPEVLDLIFWAYRNDVTGKDFEIISSHSLISNNIEQCNDVDDWTEVEGLWYMDYPQNYIGLRNKETTYWLPYLGVFDVCEENKEDDNIYYKKWEKLNLDTLLSYAEKTYFFPELEQFKMEFSIDTVNVSEHEYLTGILENASMLVKDNSVEVWSKGKKLSSFEGTIGEFENFAESTVLVKQFSKNDELETARADNFRSPEDYMIHGESEILLVANNGNSKYFNENVVFASVVNAKLKNEYYVDYFTEAGELIGQENCYFTENQNDTFFEGKMYDVLYGEWSNNAFSLKCINMETMTETEIYKWENVEDVYAFLSTDIGVIKGFCLKFEDGTEYSILFWL